MPKARLLRLIRLFKKNQQEFSWNNIGMGIKFHLPSFSSFPETVILPGSHNSRFINNKKNSKNSKRDHH